MNMASLNSLPTEILLQLADRLHNIEDFAALSSVCSKVRSALQLTPPNTILRLANNQSRVFFRPSPEFLVAATARQLGDWARQSIANEETLVTAIQQGIDGVLDLALLRCGLTMARIRELHALRFSIINPVTNIIDQCVGVQWYSVEDFWDGGRDDAYTISADPNSTFFHLAIYGELFAPDLAAYLDGDSSSHRSLTVDTRLEFIKYCVPDFANEADYGNVVLPDGSIDPRRVVKPVGPFAKNEAGHNVVIHKDNNVALVWVLKSSRWRPHWRDVRRRAGEDFQEGYEETWWYVENDEKNWRQRLWENMMMCQGLEGLGMIRSEFQDSWLERVRDWRTKIAALEREPETIKVGRQATYDYPFLMGDLRICASGYVLGT